MIRSVALAAALLLAAAPAAPAAALAAMPSKPRPVSAVQQAARCDGDAYEILDCISALLDAQDARLNRAYRAAIVQPEPGRTALRKAQRSWIRTRDAECNAVIDVGPDVRVGLQGNIEVTRCLLKRTEARAAVLERQAKP
jgi:uncharacterized protein YecT (DUF1311 family)